MKWKMKFTIENSEIIELVVNRKRKKGPNLKKGAIVLWPWLDVWMNGFAGWMNGLIGIHSTGMKVIFKRDERGENLSMWKSLLNSINKINFHTRTDGHCHHHQPTTNNIVLHRNIYRWYWMMMERKKKYKIFWKKKL